MPASAVTAKPLRSGSSRGFPFAGLTRLHVDGDSHTSVALARVLWQELHGRDLELIPFQGIGDRRRV